MSNQPVTNLKTLQEQILKQFKDEVDIEGRIGLPHLQRDNASLIIPNENKDKTLVLR